VRREYGHVPDDAFRIGRAEVLRHLLGLPVLYRAVPERAEWAFHSSQLRGVTQNP
jgi:predicted metal-dependent HD superfamily phosphohydrolase